MDARLVVLPLSLKLVGSADLDMSFLENIGEPTSLYFRSSLAAKDFVGHKNTLVYWSFE